MIASEVRDSLIEARPVSQPAIDTWLSQLESNAVSEKLLAMQRLSALDRNTQQQIVTEQAVQQVTPPVYKAWDNASELEQAWMILNSVGLDQDLPTYPGLLDRATESESKHVWYALLTRHASKADSSILTTAIGRQDLQDISRFAERQRRLLRDFAAYQEELKAKEAAEELAQ